MATEPSLKIVFSDPGWNTGTVTFNLANAVVAGEGEPEPENLHVSLQFAMQDATKAQARARAKQVLQAAIDALD